MSRQVIAGLLLILLVSCATGGEMPGISGLPEDAHPGNGLSNTRASVDELCREVLALVAQKNRNALEALALTEDEVKEYIWPYDEHSRPEVNMPFAFWWGDLHKRSSFRLTQTLQKFGGKKFELVSVRFGEDSMHYHNAIVHRDTRLTVRDEEGREWDVELFGSIVELNGQYKIFSYIYK
ncbi:MAG: hypothetical protein ACOYVJ_03465 [Nitrospirota bacterium]